MNASTQHQHHTRFLATLVALALGISAAGSQAETPRQLLDGYRTTAATPAQPARGQALFTTRQGSDWSCSSCHGALPTAAGKHVVTGKTIAPLAPAFNAERFSNPAKVEKWFRRNCNDVLGRECTAAEKADVLAWLLSLKP